MNREQQTPSWRRYLRFFGPNIERDVDDELRFHIEMRTKEFIAAGLAPDDARRRAESKFGSVERAQDECVDIQSTHARANGRAEFATTVVHDFAFGLRMLRRQALPSAVAALCIAVGIGATTAMFSIGNTLLLRPLPFPNGDRLASIGSAHAKARTAGLTVSSLPDLTDWSARQHSFSQIAVVGNWALTVATQNPIRVSGALASSNLFSTLGVSAEYGRTFSSGEDAPGGPPIAVVSHGFADRELGGASSAVGKLVMMAGTQRTIVGVIPDRMAYPAYAVVWLPLGRDVTRDSRGNRNLLAIGELRPGVSIEQADRDLATVGESVAKEHPDADADISPFAQSLREEFVGASRAPLIALACATILILLVACANVAALQISRSNIRAREIAVRTAIGAGRGRILTQLLTESVVLSLLGGVAGVALAFAARNMVASAIAHDVPAWMTFDIDMRALAFAIAASLLSAILFGLAPALRVARIDPASVLHGARTGLGASGGRLQRAFVVVEIALSVVLVIGAYLAVESAIKLHNVSLGFDATRVATFRTSLQGQRYDDPTERARTIAQLVDGIRALPEVESASTTTYAPVLSCCSQFGVTIAGRSLAPGHSLLVTGNIVTPDFFATMHIPLLAGRDFTSADVKGAPRVVIISETFAKQYWPAGDAIGHLIDTGGGGMGAIVGVVGDVKQGRIIDAPEPQFYRPYAQDPWTSMAFVVRTRTSSIPPSLAQDIRNVAHGLDPIALPIGRPRGLQEQIDASISPRALFGNLLTAFAAIALGLAAIGVYAIMSFFVAQRTRELGLRVALGAERGRVLALVLRQTAAMSVIGGIAGLVAGVFAARLLANSLFGVSAGEPSMYVVAAIALALAAFGASAAPAWRAARVDPMIALRGE